MKAVMYHYVREEQVELPYFKFLHVNDFKKQLDYLEDNFSILHPQDLKGSIANGNVKNGAVLTFDDGLKDHHQYVFPELMRRGLSGIFYISTGIYENRKILDVHRLHLLLGKAGGEEIYNCLMKLVTDDMLSHAHINEFKTLTYINQTNDEFTPLAKRILNYFISYQHRGKIIDELMNIYFGNEAELFKSFYLDNSEIADMQGNGMILGSHTATHPVLSKLTAAEQQIEIVASFDYLEKVTGGLPYKTFCYPYGGFHSFTKDTEDILHNQHCLFSFNVENRDIEVNDIINRPQALPRYDCNYFPHGSVFKRELQHEEI